MMFQWSAQESRRKRKEYMETLEDQCKSVCTENETLKKRVSDLEHDNRYVFSLLNFFSSNRISLLTPVNLTKKVASKTGEGLLIYLDVLTYA